MLNRIALPDIPGIIKNASSYIHRILEYTYTPFKQYYVTSKTCEKNNDLVDYNFMNSDIFELLDSLSNREFTGHSAIAVIHGFISQHKEYKDLIYNIIDKDLKIRAGDKVINKAVSNLIPTFSVALAKEYDKCDWNDGWYASRKLDGVRCLAVVYFECNFKL